jgi:hypothetical protein
MQKKHGHPLSRSFVVEIAPAAFKCGHSDLLL